jgi:hypothetical protein
MLQIYSHRIQENILFEHLLAACAIIFKPPSQ